MRDWDCCQAGQPAVQARPGDGRQQLQYLLLDQLLHHNLIVSSDRCVSLKEGNAFHISTETQEIVPSIFSDHLEGEEKKLS